MNSDDNRPDVAPNTVEVASADDVLALAEVRARAFFNDPMQRWLFPDDSSRLDSLLRAARHGLPRSVQLGRVTCTADRQSMATWWRPDERPESQLRALVRQVRLAPLLLRFGPPLRIAFSADGLLREHLPDGPHWMLASIATHPQAQGEGRATALLNAGLRACDQAKMPCFLSTANGSNVPFYEKFGFHTVGQVALPADGPTEYLMTRQPR